MRNPPTTHPSEWTSEVGKRWAERVSAGLPFRWSTGDSERTLEKKTKKKSIRVQGGGRNEDDGM